MGQCICEVHTEGEADSKGPGCAWQQRGLEDDIKTWILDIRNREAYRRKWFGDESDDLSSRQFESSQRVALTE